MAPLTRTACSDSAGSAGTMSDMRRTTGSARGATTSGCRKVSRPWATKIEASIGRAIVLTPAMGANCPAAPSCNARLLNAHGLPRLAKTGPDQLEFSAQLNTAHPEGWRDTAL